MVLHEGKLLKCAQVKGKLEVCTLPIYLNAWKAKGHLVTVNEYLAERDAEWMSGSPNFLGSQHCNHQTWSKRRGKRAAYNADITYGTNNEFGFFGYLRDNMAQTRNNRFKGPCIALLDEVDSILID